MFEQLKTNAAAAIAALKADTRSAEERIEDAFSLGARTHALDAILKMEASVEDKVKAAFDLGYKSQS